MKSSLVRRDFLKFAALGPSGLAAALQAQDCLPEGITREDLVNLLDGPWQRLRAVLEKKVVDFHTHNWQYQDTGFTFRERAEIIRSQQGVDFTDDQVRDMRIHGIDRAVVQPPRVATWVKYEDYLKSIARYPTKLLEVADADPKAKMTIPQQVEYIRGRLKAGARMLFAPGIDDEKVSPDKIRPFMELAEEFDVPVQGDLGPMAGTNIWTIRDPLRIAPLLEAFPKVKFAMGHSGGAKGLGFMVPQGYLGIQMAAFYDNLYWDTNGSSIEFIERTVKSVGAHRLLFGSDLGYVGIREYLPMGYRAASTRWRNLNAVALARITEDQRDMILHKNARRLLKLEA